jgi:hypothetical protein
VEEKLFNLNKIQQNNQRDLSNLNFQINKINVKTNDQKNILMDKNKENSSLIKQIKEEKEINNKLYNELNNKDKELYTSKEQLGIANDDLSKLENSYDQLKISYNKNNNDLNVINSNFLTEKARNEETEKNNKALENNILEKEEILKKEKEENIELNKDINQLELDTNFLIKQLEGFKTHIFIMSDANKNMVKELENVLIRDEKIEYALGRDEIMEDIKDQNRNIVLNSRKNVNEIMNGYNEINVNNNNRKLSYEYDSNATDKNKQTNNSKDNINMNNNSNFKKFQNNENDDNELNNNINQESENNNEEILNDKKENKKIENEEEIEDKSKE